MGDGIRLEPGRATSLEGSTPSPSALTTIALADQLDWSPRCQRGDQGFKSPPGYCIDVSAGHWRAQVAVTHPHYAVQVQLLPDTLTWPVRLLVRSPVFQAGQRGSKPLRATEEPADTAARPETRMLCASGVHAPLRDRKRVGSFLLARW